MTLNTKSHRPAETTGAIKLDQLLKYHVSQSFALEVLSLSCYDGCLQVC